MTKSDLEGLKNIIERSGAMDSSNRDLIENAIWCIRNGNDYRAESSIRTLAANLRNSGRYDLAEHAARLL